MLVLGRPFSFSFSFFLFGYVGIEFIEKNPSRNHLREELRWKYKPDQMCCFVNMHALVYGVFANNVTYKATKNRCESETMIYLLYHSVQ